MLSINQSINIYFWYTRFLGRRFSIFFISQIEETCTFMNSLKYLIIETIMTNYRNYYNYYPYWITSCFRDWGYLQQTELNSSESTGVFTTKIRVKFGAFEISRIEPGLIKSHLYLFTFA